MKQEIINSNVYRKAYVDSSTVKKVCINKDDMILKKKQMKGHNSGISLHTRKTNPTQHLLLTYCQLIER